VLPPPGWMQKTGAAPWACRSGTRLESWALLLAFQLAHANRRKLTAWANSIALHGDRPHRRPTRRRKTKPLGTWTPKGYVTNP
jgi:hypothetical protein